MLLIFKEQRIAAFWKLASGDSDSIKVETLISLNIKDCQYS